MEKLLGSNKLGGIPPYQGGPGTLILKEVQKIETLRVPEGQGTGQGKVSLAGLTEKQRH